MFADRGRSGYHGVHRTHGRLGKLIEAAKAGNFDAGTVIVIEAWDRLGRLRPDKQTELVSELLRTGVSIGVCRLDDVFAEDDFGTHKWTTLAVFIQLAFQESKQKAERVGASWARRREKAREGIGLLGARLPAWVEIVNGEHRLIPDRTAAVQRIFKLAADGMGHTKIVRTLEKEKVPAFGEKVVRENRVRSQFAGRWTKPYVALLLRDRRVIGEMQPMKNDKPDGATLLNYYPPAITESQFVFARAAQEERLNYDVLGRKNGPRQGKYVNVFKSMLTHARDGLGFLLHNKGSSANPLLILITAASNGGNGGKGFTFPYPIFEESVLKYLKEIDPATVMPAIEVAASAADVTRAKLKNVREAIARLKDDLRAGYSKTLVELLREAEGNEVTLVNELQDELVRTAKPLARTWSEMPSLIDLVHKASDPEAARLKLRCAIRAAIETCTLLIVVRGSWRIAVLQFRFAGGTRRCWIIAHQTAGNQRPGRTAAGSFADLGLTVDAGSEFDLRNPGDARTVEKTLNAIDLNTFATLKRDARNGTPEKPQAAAGRKAGGPATRRLRSPSRRL